MTPWDYCQLGKNPFPVRRCHVSQRSDFHMVQLNYHTPVILNKQAKPLAIPEGKQHYQSNVSVTITQSLRGALLIKSLKFYFSGAASSAVRTFSR